MSVAQYWQSIEHPTGGGSYDEAVNLGATVNAVVTVTDGDGDVATKSVAIGSRDRLRGRRPERGDRGHRHLVTQDETLDFRMRRRSPGGPGAANDNDVAGPLTVFDGMPTNSRTWSGMR